MDTVFVETLERLTSLLERSPLDVMLAVILLTLLYFIYVGGLLKILRSNMFFSIHLAIKLNF